MREYEQDNLPEKERQELRDYLQWLEEDGNDKG